MFEPLALPEETDEGYWVVTVQSEEYLQLHDDGGLYEGIDCNGASAYFDRECEAFSMACNYYTSYKEVYPYFSEYSDAISRAYNQLLEEQTNIVNTTESEIMEFA